MASQNLGAAWSSSSVNCVPFRTAIAPTGDGFVVGFYDEAANVVLQWLDHRLNLQRRTAAKSPILPHDAHQCISVGTDSDGGVHAVFGAHASAAWHIRIHPENEAGAPLPVAPLASANRFTYPMFIAPNAAHDLVLLYRQGGAWDGEIDAMRWSAETQSFIADPQPLITGHIGRPRCGPYLNRPVSLPDGRLGLFAVWRMDPRATSAGDVANRGVDFVCLDAGLARLTTWDGIDLARPVTPVHSPCVWAVPVGANLMNQAAAAAFAQTDRPPAALTYWNDGVGIPQYQLVWNEAGRWRATAVSQFRTRFDLAGRGTLPLPHSRPDLLLRDDGTALCLFRSAEFGNRLMITVITPPYDDIGRRATHMLIDRDLGHYEPIIDHAAFARDGSLVMYVQHCSQGDGDGSQRPDASPATMLRWSGEQVAGWRARPGLVSRLRLRHRR